MTFTLINPTQTPTLENLILICKIKTFTWIQFLCKNNKLDNVDFYDPTSIYVDLKLCLQKIDIEYFGNETNNLRNYKLVLKNNNKYFVFKIVLDEIAPKQEKNQNNDYEYKDGFIYPDTLYFYKKMKTEVTANKFLMSQFYCSPKALFFGTVSIKKICLIDRAEFQKIAMLSSSDYTTQKLNYNTINYHDITYIFFYHPEYNTFNDIYGFQYHNTNPVSLVSIDTRLKRPKTIKK